MPSIAEILEARRAARAAAAASAGACTEKPKLDPLNDPDDAFIVAAIEIFKAEIEENPPEIATPFGPRMAKGEELL